MEYSVYCAYYMAIRYDANWYGYGYYYSGYWWLKAKGLGADYTWAAILSYTIKVPAAEA